MSQVVLQLERALEQQESKQLLVLNELASISAGVHPQDDENDLLVNNRGLPAATDVQNLIPPLAEQNKIKVVKAEIPSGMKDGRKATRHKQSRLWPWKAFWNRIKQIKKYELLLPASTRPERTSSPHDASSPKTAASTRPECTSSPHGASSPEAGLEPNARHGDPSQHPYLDYCEACHFQGHTAECCPKILNLVASQYQMCWQHRANLVAAATPTTLSDTGASHHVTSDLSNLLHAPYDCPDGIVIGDVIGLPVALTGEAWQRQHLQWPVRFKIIMGIAQGLVYLHQDSGPRITIHRDLEPSNILLDSEMNPKISNFAYARTEVEHQPELDMEICGTIGYMSPECCMQGRASAESDVFSFGVVVLEIVSGRRSIMNTPYWHPMMFLSDYAWKLWNEGRALNLVDNSLGRAFMEAEALRCIKVGLLCTQQQPGQRPKMPYVLKMLRGDELPQEPHGLQLQEKFLHAAVDIRNARYELNHTL